MIFPELSENYLQHINWNENDNTNNTSTVFPQKKPAKFIFKMQILWSKFQVPNFNDGKITEIKQ